MPSKKNVTIRDVAKAAGVSAATVSRVLSDENYLIEETRQKVFAAVEETGYRILQNKKSRISKKNILVLCSSLKDPASSYYLNGIEKKAAEAGFRIFLKHLSMDQLIHQQMDAGLVLDWAETCSAAGVLAFTDLMEDAQILALSEKLPTVCMLTGSAAEGVSAVNPDERSMMRKLVQHLMHAGKKKIALLLGQPQHRRNIMLKQAYLEALAENALEINPAWCVSIDTDYYSTSAAVAAEQMLSGENPPDAIIGATDIFAAGAMFACRKRGKKIPEEVAVAGRDNTSVCHVFTPPITAFDLPAGMIGYTACDCLIGLIEDPLVGVRRIELDCDLIIRGSTL